MPPGDIMQFISHIEHAIDAANRQDFDDALLHATIAVDKASQLWANISESDKTTYKSFLRNYDWLIERFADIMPKSLCTKFQTTLPNGRREQCDLVDLIYHIYRCNLCHGNEIPLEYKMVPQSGTTITANNNEIISLPSSIIWGLLAAAIFSKNSKEVTSTTQYELWYTPRQPVKIDEIKLPGKRLLVSYLADIGEKSVFNIGDTIGEEDMIRQYCDGLPPPTIITEEKFLVKNESVSFLTIILSNAR